MVSKIRFINNQITKWVWKNSHTSCLEGVLAGSFNVAYVFQNVSLTLLTNCNLECRNSLSGKNTA